MPVHYRMLIDTLARQLLGDKMLKEKLASRCVVTMKEGLGTKGRLRFQTEEDRIEQGAILRIDRNMIQLRNALRGSVMSQRASPVVPFRARCCKLDWMCGGVAPVTELSVDEGIGVVGFDLGPRLIRA